MMSRLARTHVAGQGLGKRTNTGPRYVIEEVGKAVNVRNKRI
jgi:hypothetical protein